LIVSNDTIIEINSTYRGGEISYFTAECADFQKIATFIYYSLNIQ